MKVLNFQYSFFFRLLNVSREVQEILGLLFFVIFTTYIMRNFKLLFFKEVKTMKKLQELFNEKLNKIESLSPGTDTFNDSINDLKILHDILKDEKRIEIDESEITQKIRENDLKEIELKIKSVQLKNESDSKKEEIKEKRFDTIMRVGGIIISGALTVVQIITVGRLEKESILSNHAFSFIKKSNKSN